MSISVIIAVSPGRRDNLLACLEMLSCQSLAPADVWVEADGPSDCAEALAALAPPWPLHYHERSRDFCVARSRNLGAARAQSEQLVFLDCDVLLQPGGLAAYARHAHKYPESAFYGYVGHQVEQRAYSAFFPEREVCAQDLRFFYQQGQFQTLPALLKTPQLFAWSGNCSLPRSVFEAVKGFDQGFQGPGWEDVDLGNRLVRAGFRLVFSLEAWAEHLLHEKAVSAPLQKAKNRQRVGPLWPSQPPLFFEPGPDSALEAILAQRESFGFSLDPEPFF
jgi:GT2 family glycosyltransferase